MESEVLSYQHLKKIDPVFGQHSFDDHEQVVFCADKDTGLKAIIGIHNTILGPALGGTRMRNYPNEWEALNDVLRLSRGMTYKAAITGLNLGGGKAIIIGDANTDKTSELMTAFAKCIHDLGGKYITAEDMGMETADMDFMRDITPYVTGVSEAKGGAGNPSPVTAYGVFMGMKAASKYKFGTDHLRGKKVLVEGVGHVGEVLVDYLSREDAEVYITDINEDRLQTLHKKYGVRIFRGTALYNADVDIYAPCALGATINDHTIYGIRAGVIAGAANNQLADEKKHGELLKKRAISYAPDFLINAGGIINVYAELAGYGKSEIIQKTENIYHTTLEIFSHADTKGCTTHEAAFRIAQSRIDTQKLAHKN